MASIAGGMDYGVASEANLVIVKFQNAALSQGTAGIGLQMQPPTVNALIHAWDWVINDVTGQRQSGNDGKFIITMSFGEFGILFLKSRR
jgi:hypothetical protein